MGPETFYLPDEDVVTLSTRVLQLFRQALPDPGDRRLFNRLMHEARAKGMTWIEGLEYAAGRRSASFR